MIEFAKAKRRFLEFGGMTLLREYARIGALLPGIKALLKCVAKRKPLKLAYPAMLSKVEPLLETRYKPMMLQRMEEYSKMEPFGERSNKIWVCWLQGMANAPEIVKSCYNSLRINLKGREIILLDANNISDYVTLPDYVERKWQEGKIPAASYSDIVRLSLLSQYGGTWIDATVLCTGSDFPPEYLDSDLFFFQYTRPGTNDFHGISNWFVTARSAHPVIMTLRDLLCEYWRDYDCLVDYYMFHFYFLLMTREYPELLPSMPFGYSGYCLVLLTHFGEPYDPDKWQRLEAYSCFHKLGCRLSKDITSDKDNYYAHVLKLFSCDTHID